VSGKRRCVTILAVSREESESSTAPFPSTEKTRFTVEAFACSPVPFAGQEIAFGASTIEEPSSVTIAFSLPSSPVPATFLNSTVVKIGAAVLRAVIPVSTVSIVQPSIAGQVNAFELLRATPVAQFAT